MTVLQSLDRLEVSYIKFMEKNDYGDPGYVWWERIKDCQKWCNKEKTYVPMSDTQTLKIMREWVKRQKAYDLVQLEVTIIFRILKYINS